MCRNTVLGLSRLRLRNGFRNDNQLATGIQSKISRMNIFFLQMNIFLHTFQMILSNKKKSKKDVCHKNLVIFFIQQIFFSFWSSREQNRSKTQYFGYLWWHFDIFSKISEYKIDHVSITKNCKKRKIVFS